MVFIIVILQKKNSNFVGLHQNYLYIPQVNERVVRRWKYFFLIKDRNQVHQNIYCKKTRWKNLINVFSVNNHSTILIPLRYMNRCTSLRCVPVSQWLLPVKRSPGNGAQWLRLSKQMNKNRIYLSYKIFFYMHLAFCVNNFS